MAATDALGTRLAYHLTEDTAFTAIAAGASLPSGWVQVLNVQNVRAIANVQETYDDGDLEDSAEVLRVQIKSGKITFQMKSNGSQTKTLLDMCNGSDLNAWVVVDDVSYTHWTGKGMLTVQGWSAQNDRSLRARALVDFEVVSRTVLTIAASA